MRSTTSLVDSWSHPALSLLCRKPLIRLSNDIGNMVIILRSFSANPACE
jgi:hypothetical protein